MKLLFRINVWPPTVCSIHWICADFCLQALWVRCFRLILQYEHKTTPSWVSGSVSRLFIAMLYDYYSMWEGVSFVRAIKNFDHLIYKCWNYFLIRFTRQMQINWCGVCWAGMRLSFLYTRYTIHSMWICDLYAY